MKTILLLATSPVWLPLAAVWLVSVAVGGMAYLLLTWLSVVASSNNLTTVTP